MGSSTLIARACAEATDQDNVKMSVAAKVRIGISFCKVTVRCSGDRYLVSWDLFILLDNQEAFVGYDIRVSSSIRPAPGAL